MPRATAAASESSENRVRAAMNRRIGRSEGSAAISSSVARVSSSRILVANGSLKMTPPSSV
jgi:hypothetical protein